MTYSMNKKSKKLSIANNFLLRTLLWMLKKRKESRRVATIFHYHFIFKYEMCLILKQNFEVIFYILDMHIFTKHNKPSK